MRITTHCSKHIDLHEKNEQCGNFKYFADIEVNAI